MALLVVVGKDILRVAATLRAVKRTSVNVVVLVAIPHNSVPIVGCKLILAIDLSLAAALGARAGPDIDVVLAAIPVRDALGAGVLEDEVLLGIWVPDDLALVELARGGSEGAGVVVGALAAGGVATAAVV